MGAEGRKITNTGLFQSGKGVRVIGIYFILMSLCLITVACVQFFAGDLLVAIPLLAVAVFLIFIGISNIIVVSRLRSKDFTNGEAREIIVLDGLDEHTKYVAFVEPDGKCPDRNGAGSGGTKDTAERP